MQYILECPKIRGEGLGAVVSPRLSGQLEWEWQQKMERIFCRFPTFVAVVVFGTAPDDAVTSPAGSSDKTLFLESRAQTLCCHGLELI